jgi:hypothetical protein
MSRESVASAILGVAGVVVVLVVGVLVVVALGPGSTTIVVHPPIEFDDVESAGPSAAIVISKHETGGSWIPGFTIGRTSLVRVQFFDEPGCLEAVSSSQDWPTPHEECTSTVLVRGQATRVGRAATGRSIISVDVEVSNSCYDTVMPGDSWPTSAPECESSG